MIEGIEDLFEEKGLRRVEDIEELFYSKSFIVRSAWGCTETFPIYPIIQRKKNLTHNLLSLFGIHWRYDVQGSDWERFERKDGDVEKVLADLRSETKTRRQARYVFHQQEINRAKGLWIFRENTPGWEYQNNVLIPQFKADLADYKAERRVIEEARKANN